MAKKADAKTADAAQAATEAAGPKSKKMAWIAGLVIACATGATLAITALPKKAEPTPTLDGPFVAALAKESVQVNLAGENGKRYLVLGLNAEYFAYDERYTTARLGGGGDDHGAGGTAPDPLYTAMLTDSLLRIAGGKTREQVEDPVQMEAFLMEIRAAIEPLLFPLCVGDSIAPQVADSHSGLRVGESVMDSTLRGLLHEHFLQLDVHKKTVRLDDGPETAFKGDERDLRITGPNGEAVFLNVSDLEPEFAGKVPIGVAGRVRRIYREQVLVQ